MTGSQSVEDHPPLDEADIAVSTTQANGTRRVGQREILLRARDALTTTTRLQASPAEQQPLSVSTGLPRDLRSDHQDFAPFFQSLTAILAEGLTDERRQVWCSVTVLGSEGARTLARSSERAEVLDEIQYALDDGPCLTAAREEKLVYVGDAFTHPRWSPYLKAAAGRYGLRCVLAIPFDLAGAGPSCLNVQCDRPHALDSAQIQAVRKFLLEASAATNGALRLHPRPGAM